VSGIFASASGFGDTATFTFGSLSRVINVVFDEYYKSTDIYGNEVANTGPVAFCATADVEDSDGNVPGENSTATATLEVNSVTFKIVNCERGGDSSILKLSRD
jgi:hypothetical protein